MACVYIVLRQDYKTLVIVYSRIKKKLVLRRPIVSDIQK